MFVLVHGAGCVRTDDSAGRRGAPHEVARAALYLASGESVYVTGTNLVVDGGIAAGRQAT